MKTGFFIIEILTITAYAAYLILALRYFLHMLQLASYQLPGYFLHLKQEKKAILAARKSGCLFIIIQGIFFTWLVRYILEESSAVSAGESVIFMLYGLCGIAAGVAYSLKFRPKPAKKKFVFTDRVKRLTVTVGILMAVTVAVCCILFSHFVYASSRHISLFSAIVVIVFSLPLIYPDKLIALAKKINDPVEKKINDGFIHDAGRILREQPRLRILGITGSFGKTSVKYYVTTLLSEKYNVLMTPESYNTPMGIVRTIREKMKPTDEIFVCEMGARHVGDIKEITDFVHPDDGLLSAIGEQHLETFFTLENIIDTKYSLLDVIPQGGLRFVNGDNEIIRANMRYPDAFTYGLSEDNDFRAVNLTVSEHGTEFNVKLSGRARDELSRSPVQYSLIKRTFEPTESIEKTVKPGCPANADTESNTVYHADAGTDTDIEGVRFRTALVGAHNVQNIMGAIAVSALYGVPAAKLAMGVRRIEAVPHRLSLASYGNVAVLDDSYNSNPTGAKTALETLAHFENRVKILVTPGMVELGEKEEELNRAFGAQAAGVCDYIILVGEKRTEPIADGALKANFEKERLFVRNTFDEASKLMYEIDAGKQKVILLENDLPDNY